MRSAVTLVILSIPAILLAGCVHYSTAPVSPAGIVAQRAKTSLDLQAVASECKRLAPAAPCDPQQFDRAMLYAAMLRYNPSVALARASLASAAAAARAAHAPPGPTLTLTSEYAGAAPDPSPWLFGGVLDVPLDMGARRSTRLAGAGLAIVAARYDFVEAVWTARMAVTHALAECLIAERQIGVLGELVGLQQRRFSGMEQRLAHGEIARAEMERARADLAEAQRRQGEARVRLEAANAALAAAIGIPVSSQQSVDLVWDDFDVPSGEVPISTSERQEALLARADILKSVTAYDQAEVDLRGEVAKQFPTISIGPGFTWERGLVKIPFNIGLVLPPLDLNRRAIAAAEARRSEAGKRLEADVAGAEAAIGQALIEAKAARQQLARIRAVDVPVAERLAGQANRELSAGAIDRIDWAIAQAGLVTARLTELDALARLRSADAALEGALRRPTSGPETMIGRQVQ